jgi:hypothetical protein
MPTRRKTLDLTTNAALRDFYRVYSHMYFGSRLPDNVIIYFGKPPKASAAYVDIRGEGEDTTVEIMLDERLRGMDTIVAGLLVHEMAHLDIDDEGRKHEKHDKRMLELARAGALNGIW